MGKASRSASYRAPCLAALILAWPVAAAGQTTVSADPPDPELLQYLGETSGMNPELVSFMESREARRAMKDVARKAPEEVDAKPERLADPEVPPDAGPPGSEQLMSEGAARWRSMDVTERAAARARFNTWRQLPEEERELLRERWKRFRELTPAQQEALHEAYREFLELPPERRDMLSNRWQQMSPEERRRAIQRRQGSKPGSVDKRPCPPC